ncbi:kinetochore-associated protein NSL1 homolog [Pezoporus occidentalis]|uniref:kinetochore-associated protein NSL1 homolog n=1 Tax=Pezoporus occidentalis TaxID=407982 RepID=UPI002F907097
MPRRGRRGRGGVAAGSASGPAFPLRARREMATPPRPPLSPGPAGRDARVRCCRRRGLAEAMELCAPFLRALEQGQPGGTVTAGDALWNFKTAVQENVTINGQPWDEAQDDSKPESGSDIKVLEDEFDKVIVVTTTKRKQWPRKILIHAIQAMKAEQELLMLYQPVVPPEEIRSPPSQDAYIADLKQVMEMASKHIREAMTTLPGLIERAEGFSQALTWQPTLELCRVQQGVFACKEKKETDVQNLFSPGEVTPTDTGTNKNVLLKRRKAVGSPERRRYPLRRRKIALST